jgi:tetratricopeptide (TPR) repeat protein
MVARGQSAGQLSDAEREYKAALASCDPQQCPELPVILNGLGGLYYELGRYNDAEPLLLRAVELLRRTDHDSRLLPAALSNLAAVYRIRGRFTEAKSLYDQARNLQGLEQSFEGGDRLESPSLLVRLALLTKDMGDLAGAAELIRSALEALARNGAEDTAEGARALATWAAILETQGHPQEAEQVLKRALAICERISGPNDISVADELNTLGISYSHRNRWADAESSLRRSVAILRMYPPLPLLASALNNLGSVWLAQGHKKEAEASIRQAVATWELLLGPNHPNVAAGLTNLAASLQARGRDEEAARMLDRARAIDQKSFPADHPRIGIDLSRSGALAKSRKRYVEAEDLLRRAYTILEGALPPTDQELGIASLNLADVLRLQKRLDPSAEMYQRGLDIVTSAWGPNDPRLASWLDGYVSVLRDQKEFAKAARLEIQATRIRVTKTLRN